ncbi:DUF3825 domain-containing protein [Streptomyces sp. NPDC018000]|uniref:DUF3825 domain-containing protein n=1 Tax=Streptomyces sp. NPDC018000 TaxID=3365028 RepID=UPI0037B5A191
MAEPENWDGREAKAPDGNRILRNYVRWTFERAHQQGKISTSSDGAHSAFNTGLATARQETIYGLVRRNNRPDSQPWAGSSSTTRRWCGRGWGPGCRRR